MDANWQLLCDAGVPLAGAHDRSRSFERVAVAQAASGALRSETDAVALEALGAFVRAWAQHWPTSFAHAFGDAAEDCLTRATRAETTRDRYLKLRRIALAHLARWA